MQQRLKFMPLVLLRAFVLFSCNERGKDFLKEGRVAVHRTVLQSVDLLGSTTCKNCLRYSWSRSFSSALTRNLRMPLTGSLFVQDSQCSWSSCIAVRDDYSDSLGVTDTFVRSQVRMSGSHLVKEERKGFKYW